MKLDKSELAWAAGFFDGEGCSGQTAGKFYLHIAQVNQTTLARFRLAVGGLGKITGPYQPKAQNRRPQWRYYVRGFELTQAVIAILWFKLSEPKKAQFKEATCLISSLPATTAKP